MVDMFDKEIGERKFAGYCKEKAAIEERLKRPISNGKRGKLRYRRSVLERLIVARSKNMAFGSR